MASVSGKPKRIRLITVVGLIANARTESLAEAGVPNHLDCIRRRKTLAIFLRGNLDAAAIPNEVREQVQSVDPTLPFQPRTLNETVSASLAESASMEIVALFALTLCCSLDLEFTE